MSLPIRAIVNFVTKDPETFLGAARNVLNATRKEPGCLTANLFREIGSITGESGEATGATAASGESRFQ